VALSGAAVFDDNLAGGENVPLHGIDDDRAPRLPGIETQFGVQGKHLEIIGVSRASRRVGASVARRPPGVLVSGHRVFESIYRTRRVCNVDVGRNALWQVIGGRGDVVHDPVHGGVGAGFALAFGNST
jgi:hypothetical protein